MTAAPLPAAPVRDAKQSAGGLTAGGLALGLAIGIILGAIGFFAVSRITAIVHPQPQAGNAAPVSGKAGALPENHGADAGTGERAVSDTAEVENSAASDGTGTSSLPTDAPELDLTDAETTMHFLVYLIFNNRPQLVERLIGDYGCVFAPYATEVETPATNNGPEISATLQSALQDSDATCLGWSLVEHGQPDKATMYWMGLNFDWAALGLESYAAPVVAFEFFKIEGEWNLSFISPVPDDLVPDGNELLPVPLEPPPAD